jgi:hypothetical protein
VKTAVDHAFWEIRLSTFHFSKQLEWWAEKKNRRRKHFYFSSAIFDFNFSLSTFENTWTGPKQKKNFRVLNFSDP